MGALGLIFVGVVSCVVVLFVLSFTIILMGKKELAESMVTLIVILISQQMH